MARFSTDSSLIYYLTTSVLSVTAILLPCIPVPSRISCGVHQGCVLGHLLFTLYILTISILLFPLAHWITTFMQMTPLIHPTSTQGSPTYKPLFNMYSWMIVNLSNLNSFKSEFFLTGLKKQLATTPHSTPLSVWIVGIGWTFSYISARPPQTCILWQRLSIALNHPKCGHAGYNVYHKCLLSYFTSVLRLFG